MDTQSINADKVMQLSSERSRRTVIFLSLIIGSILLVGGASLHFFNVHQLAITLLLGFGISFTASALISYIMLSAGLLDLSHHALDLANIIGTKLEIPCVERFPLVLSCVQVGFCKVYGKRKDALSKENFCISISKEKNEIFIVGSSLLGLLQKDRDYKFIMEEITKKIDYGIEIKFMLTHPLFADFRAAQEGRNPKEIGGEIIASLRKIKELSKYSNSNISVYLYRGTPTCFGISTTTSMFIDPYTYGRPAYDSPCFELKGGSSAYNFYKQAHFQTQFAGKIEDFDLTEQNISILENHVDDFSRKVIDFEGYFKSLSTQQAHGL